MPAAIKHTPEQIAQMIKAHEEGTSAKDIAAAMGCSKSTVCERIESAGVKMDRARSISKKMTGRPGSRRGARHTEESKAKMSAANNGRPGTRFGPHSTETLKKISDGTKGKNVLYTPEEKRRVESLRTLLKRIVRRTLSASGKRKSIPSERYLGYSKTELHAHLGNRPDGCDLDHYVPIAEFIRRGITDPAVINARVNLRWLESSKNKIKSDTLPKDTERVIALCLQARVSCLGGL